MEYSNSTGSVSCPLGPGCDTEGQEFCHSVPHYEERIREDSGPAKLDFSVEHPKQSEIKVYTPSPEVPSKEGRERHPNSPLFRFERRPKILDYVTAKGLVSPLFLSRFRP